MALLPDGYYKVVDDVWTMLKPLEERQSQIQTSGPQCKKCGAFTTYTRVETHGMCMKCEIESRGKE